MEKNISTVENINFRFRLENDLFDKCLDFHDESEEKEYVYSVKDSFIEEMRTVIDILKNRDTIIQLLMQIMEERFEKVWKLPWELVKIIHSFTWNIDDLRDISSKVRLLGLSSLSLSRDAKKTAQKRMRRN